MHSDSCLVMINNTIDYLVLLAITFLLVIDFIYSFAVCFWYLFPLLQSASLAKQSKKNNEPSLIDTIFLFSFATIQQTKVVWNFGQKMFFTTHHHPLCDSFPSLSKRIIRTLFRFLLSFPLSSHCVNFVSFKWTCTYISYVTILLCFIFHCVMLFSLLHRNWE